MNFRLRRLSIVSIVAISIVNTLVAAFPYEPAPASPTPVTPVAEQGESAHAVLGQLEVKGRAPKTGYERSQFGSGWTTERGCNTRHVILYRDVTNAEIDERCRVVAGVLYDPYTLKEIPVGQDIQIDHVVALSDAWQKGAQQLKYEQRVQLANDPLNLLAVDGEANQQKGDGDAATWLPPNKGFRCQYVARQIAVKQRYTLWVTQPEKDAMLSILNTCPEQPLPSR